MKSTAWMAIMVSIQMRWRRGARAAANMPMP
jgi:hypothetical protein